MGSALVGPFRPAIQASPLRSLKDRVLLILVQTGARLCVSKTALVQSKRKAFNIAEARIADTGAAQFFDARRGVPKAEAAAVPSKRTVR